MKRFAWPLERLLAVTAGREEAAKAELFRLAWEVARQRRQIARREAQVRATLASLAEQAPQARLAGQKLFLKWSEGEIRQAAGMQKELQRLEQCRREQMQKLTEIRRERRKLEKLRERAWQEYQKQVGQWERKQLDETAQIGFVRRSQEAAAAR
ncbi:MAG: hypothetical protein NTV86_20235 [Planctomycetota bacterium]|nr:hypothetical protein [Planctomycetota bacterium]